MSLGGPTGPDRRTVTDHDRRRLKVTSRVLLAGPVLGLLAALALGLLGAGAVAGLAAFLVLCAAASVAAALTTAALAIVDEYRRVHVARRRTLTALALFAGGFVLLFLSLGVAATV
ncbi:MAG: hypothetical protein EA387_10940 [Nitriliruptor sp.]|nr:MAG: hypothetical protein EA387_10940 [Nitriliruptor sp.]